MSTTIFNILGQYVLEFLDPEALTRVSRVSKSMYCMSRATAIRVLHYLRDRHFTNLTLEASALTNPWRLLKKVSGLFNVFSH